MDRELRKRVKDVFLSVCELPLRERGEALDRACGSDKALRDEVEVLLAENDRSGPLDVPAIARFSPNESVFAEGATVAGRFKIIRRLGAGGMGEVYEAEDPVLGERVALKTIRGESIGQSSARKRFLREIRLARKISHRNVCRIHDHALHESPRGTIDAVSMELLDGENLSKYLKREGKLGPEPALAIAAQIAEGLGAAHREGVIHLDLKPANVMILPGDGATPRVVITDFGIARRVGGDSTGLTGDSQLMGTPQYMAPEQLRGEEAAAAADIYAFGVVVYELLKGQRAFAARSPAEALSERSAETDARVAELSREANRRWAGAVGRCLENDPNDRPSSAGEAVGLIDGTIKLRSKKRTARERLLVAAAAAALLLTIGGLAAAWKPALVRPVLSWIESPWAAPLPSEMRLAVLPFRLAGEGAPSREYADGLATTVIERIAALGDARARLLVIPASESLDVGEDDPAKAAKMLGANLIAHGRLAREGDRLRGELTVFNAEAAGVVASETFELPGDEPIAGREALALALAGILDVELHEAETPSEAASRAYLHYLPARGYLVRENDLDSVEKAISEFHRALAEDQEDGLVYAGLAQGYWRKYTLVKDNRSAQLAIQAADNAISYSPEAAEAHIALGRVHFGTGRYEEAVADFHQALELDPDNPDALMGLGRAYEKNNAPEAAEDILQKAIELRPKLWLGYKWMGLFHFNAGRYQQAAEQYQQILELAPNSVHGHLNIGTFYVLAEEYDKAREHWETAVQIQPRGQVLGNLANLAFLQEDYAGAIEYGARAVDLEPETHRLWGNLAAAYLKVGDSEEARKAYNAAVERARSELATNPSDPDAMVMLGHYHASLGDTRLAVELTEQALERAGRRPKILINAADTFALLNRLDRAMQLVIRALNNGYSLDHVSNSPNLKTLLQDPVLGAKLNPGTSSDPRRDRFRRPLSR